MYRILLVDDEPRHRRGLAKMIKLLRPQYEVSEAKNGQEAVAMIGAGSFDIVITDIKMPMMDGLTFMETVRESIGSTKIIILSGYAYFEYAQKAVKLGAFDYILKPVNEERVNNFLCKVENKLEQERAELNEAERIKKELDLAFPTFLEVQLN